MSGHYFLLCINGVLYDLWSTIENVLNQLDDFLAGNFLLPGAYLVIISKLEKTCPATWKLVETNKRHTSKHI